MLTEQTLLFIVKESRWESTGKKFIKKKVLNPRNKAGVISGISTFEVVPALFSAVQGRRSNLLLAMADAKEEKPGTSLQTTELANLKSLGSLNLLHQQV
jgi:hypothetical protein